MLDKKTTTFVFEIQNFSFSLSAFVDHKKKAIL